MSTVKNVWGEKRRERKPKADEFLGEEGGDELLSAALERMASIIQGLFNYYSKIVTSAKD